MPNFKIFAAAVTKSLEAMGNSNLVLRTAITGDDLWAAYLAAFPEGTNPIFRQRTYHDGSYDKNFIRQIGGLITFDKKGDIVTIWQKLDVPHPYDVVSETLDKLVRETAIKGLFRTKEGSFGHLPNVELIDGKSHRWNHFYIQTPAKWKSNRPETDAGEFNTNVQVFDRGLRELTMDSLTTIRDLIAENNLYRGAEFKNAVLYFIKLKKEYDKDANKQTFAWRNPPSQFRSSVIGSLAIDLSNGVPLEDAVRMFESKVAPTNYRRPKSLVTQKMVDEAMKQIKDLDLEDSFSRRMATLSDVSVNDVLWADGNAAGKMKDGIAGLLDAAVSPVRPTREITPISVEAFLQKLATTKKMEIFVENRLEGNLVTVTAPVYPDSKPLFTWNNNFAWSYKGNVTDSIVEKVRKYGGKTEGKMRVSLAWFNSDDLDLHCDGPDGHIYYGSKKGILDLDMNGMDKHSDHEPVENMIWQHVKDGSYTVSVHQYSQRKMTDVGFTIEFAFNGQIQQYAYTQRVGQDSRVPCFTFSIRNGEIKDFHASSVLEKGGQSKTVNGVNTGTFVAVDTLMLSPNHWGTNEVGNKHYFFMLHGCKTDEPVRGIYNEFINPKLGLNKRVVEVLGNKTMCPVADNQLSGLGFSSTKKDTVTIRMDGRPFIVQF